MPIAAAISPMIDLDAYFARIGYSGAREPTLHTLRALQLQHPLAIPFENLDPLLGRPVRLEPDALERKLVADKRGGYCFEQNLLLAHALRALGFTVTYLAGRVVWKRGDHDRPRTHMLLLVQLGEDVHLCDVGFGALTLTAPLRLEPGVEQSTPHEPFRVRREASDYVMEARLGGEWHALYRFDLQAQRQADIEVLNYYISTHPNSHFRTRLMAARPTAHGRFTLGDNVLSRYGAGGEAERRTLGSVAELRDALALTFGIELPADERLDPALAGVIR
ncbi:MAG TPA: arylamine N-acetyltransferase [Gammaproteobacteria bacterium]|nr:arylamine N-acetyltransferase [Gammaproteobacteria bacterium]